MQEEKTQLLPENETFVEGQNIVEKRIINIF